MVRIHHTGELVTRRSDRLYYWAESVGDDANERKWEFEISYAVRVS